MNRGLLNWPILNPPFHSACFNRTTQQINRFVIRRNNSVNHLLIVHVQCELKSIEVYRVGRNWLIFKINHNLLSKLNNNSFISAQSTNCRIFFMTDTETLLPIPEQPPVVFSHQQTPPPRCYQCVDCTNCR